MTDLKPPTPPNPADAARGAKKGLSGLLKGKPAWMWVAGVTVMLGVAYLAWSRQTAAADNAATDGAPDGTDPSTVGGADQYYDGGIGGSPAYATPAASQGAYGGYDYPAPDPVQPADNAGSPEAAGTTLVIVQPGPSNQQGGTVTQTTPAPSHSVTGGGPPKRPTHYPAHTNKTHNSRAGRQYITRTMHGHTFHLYESHSGRGDWGQRPQDRVDLGPSGGGRKKPPKHHRKHHHKKPKAHR